MPHPQNDNRIAEIPESDISSRPDEVCLVVGDWFVDEHWVCGAHRSSTSSRTGRSHLRALHCTTSNVRAFCGTGRSAQFLHYLYRRSPDALPLADLIGLGFWHRADTKDLASLFDPRSPAQTPYRLTTPDLGDPNGIELINMNDALNFDRGSRNEEQHQRWRDEREYTTRIIRIYTQGERDEVVYDRLDWELKTHVGQFASADVDWQEPQLHELERLIRGKLRGRRVSAVVVKDLQKGVINPKIIDLIISLNLGAPAWYVSSKRWRPGWLEGLGNRVDLRLVMVPQVAGQTAIRKNQKLTRWITHSGRPSKEAVAIIDDLAKFTQTKTLIILPEGFSALACNCSAGTVTSCSVQSRTKPERVTVEMGYASIVFPALIAGMSDSCDQRLDLEALMNLAFRAAYEWVECEALRVLEPRYWKADPATWKAEDTQALTQIRARLHAHSQQDPIKPFGVIQSKDWLKEGTEWSEALTDLGILKRTTGGKAIELWRAMSEIEGYVCCEESMRDNLRCLLRGVQSFAKHPRYHTSCMLVASPGSGKTFLAKRLAETAGLQFIPFNITQMRAKADILECLDTIVATQAQDSDRPLMAFIDEINAKLENAPVYGAFLTPLEDGTYVHSGRTFNIRPCVWIFAGTREPSTSSETRVDVRNSISGETPDKGSDFVSRLTLGLINLTNSSDGQGQPGRNIQDQKMRATEKVYMGVCMLRHEFPDVRRVSELVLRAFWELPQTTTVREIKHFVRRFSDIQYGEVTARSVPDRWPGDSEDERDLRRWKELNRGGQYTDKADVEIVTGVRVNPR